MNKCILSWHSATALKIILIIPKIEIVEERKVKIVAAPNLVTTMLKVSITTENEEMVVMTMKDASGRELLTRLVRTSEKGIQINMSKHIQGFFIK